MTATSDLARLALLAQLALDHKLAALRENAGKLEQSRMLLSSLNQAEQSVDLDPVTSSKVGIEYEKWADIRRAELNLVIARQTAAWMEARSEAQIAFGRVQALQGVSEKLRNDRR